MWKRGITTGKKRVSVLLIIGLICGSLVLVGSAQAGPITTFTGSIALSSSVGSGMDGTINYAVFTSTDFSADAAAYLSKFTPGTSSPALDLTAGGYVYLYQIVNDGPNPTAISTFSTGLGYPAVPITSWGYLKDTVFTDPGGSVSSSNSLDAGTSVVGFTTTTPVNPMVVQLTSSSVRDTFFPTIVANETSSLLVYTSALAPGWVSSQISSATGGAAGSTPGAVAIPEPGTLLLISLGVVGLAGARRFHRKGGRTMSGDKQRIRYLIAVVLLAFGFLGLAGRGEAAPIADFTGNTYFESFTPGGVTVTVNYAVIPGADLVGSPFLAAFQPGTNIATAALSPALDLSGLVFLFQVTNSGPVNTSALTVQIPGVNPTAWGYFTDIVFKESGGAIVDAGNNLGVDGPGVPGDPRVGVTAVDFATLLGAIEPTQVLLYPGTQIENVFSIPQLAPTETSSLMVYSSPYAPTMVFAKVDDNGTNAVGGVPGTTDALWVPVSEPGTLLLLGTSLLGLAGLPWWRRRRQGSA